MCQEKHAGSAPEGQVHGLPRPSRALWHVHRISTCPTHAASRTSSYARIARRGAPTAWVNNHEPRLSQCCWRFRGGGSHDCRDPRVVGVLTVRVSTGHPLSGYDLSLLPMKQPDV